LSDRQRILAWAERGVVTDARAAMIAAGVTPQPDAWRAFMDRLLLWSGAATLAASVVFFVAYNWQALGKLAKFGLVEALVVAAVIAYWRFGPASGAGKAALFAACIFTGALLALFGQTYQTGADTWELFATWAALIAPWVVIGRFAALWILWIALVNLAVTLYYTVFRGLFGLAFATEEQLWVLFVIDTGALVAWELAARRVSWLDERWAARLLVLASGALVTVLAIHAVVEPGSTSGAAFLAYPAWLACAYAFYRYRQRDLFALAGGCLSVIVVVTVFLAKHLMTGGDHAASFLLIAFVVVVMAGGAAWWLRQLAAKMRA
jgi:uncharacterized membrane protein